MLPRTGAVADVLPRTGAVVDVLPRAGAVVDVLSLDTTRKRQKSTVICKSYMYFYKCRTFLTTSIILACVSINYFVSHRIPSSVSLFEHVTTP